ncbi:hypothetical protein HYZ97_03870 [Candidatus Pacearchaeota archaeon]|nr:hypothetical protein [Candidatus Pacearchaeota archaeon]
MIGIEEQRIERKQKPQFSIPDIKEGKHVGAEDSQMDLALQQRGILIVLHPAGTDITRLLVSISNHITHRFAGIPLEQLQKAFREEVIKTPCLTVLYEEENEELSHYIYARQADTEQYFYYILPRKMRRRFGL